MISNCLLHQNEEIAVNAITTLYYLIFPDYRHLLTPEITQKAEQYQQHSNKRYKNLGMIFIEAAGKYDKNYSSESNNCEENYER